MGNRRTTEYVLVYNNSNRSTVNWSHHILRENSIAALVQSDRHLTVASSNPFKALEAFVLAPSTHYSQVANTVITVRVKLHFGRNSG